MRNDESKTEKTCRIFGELVDRLLAKGILTSGVDEPPRLQLVTVDNAHEFSQPPKRRGRKPKPAATHGNVVPIGARKTTENQVAPEITQLKPAPNDPDLHFRVRARAAGRALAALRARENRGDYDSPSDYKDHVDAAWRELGYSPP